MAFTSTSVIEVHSGGDDTNNAGIFDRGVTGFSTDGAATAGNTASPVFTSASYNFVAGDVGHYIYIKSGTNSIPGWYTIVSVAANAATLGAGIGTATLDAGILNIAAGLATVASPTGLTWGIDYSQKDSSRFTFTDMAIDATTNTKFTSAANPVGKNFVGNGIAVTSGTGFSVQRVVVASTIGTVATCDKSLGTLSSTGGNGRMGGALASPGLGGSLTVSGCFLFVKVGTYTITSASTSISGGCVVLAGASFASAPSLAVGFSSIRGDNGKPTLILNSGVSTSTMIAMSASLCICKNFIFDGNLQTSSRGSSTVPAFINCDFRRFTNIAVSGANYVERCTATLCTTQAVFSTCAYMRKVVAYANTVTAFLLCNNTVECYAINNTGASTVGFDLNSSTLTSIRSCVAYGNGQDGFLIGSGTRWIDISDNISALNGRYGFNCVASPSRLLQFHKNKAYSNSTSPYNGFPGEAELPVELTGNPFIDPATMDFNLNKNSGAGADCRGGGWGEYPSAISITSYPDIGGAQSLGFSIGVNGMNMRGNFNN